MNMTQVIERGEAYHQYVVNPTGEIQLGDTVYPRHPGPKACYGTVIGTDAYEDIATVEWEDGETSEEEFNILVRVRF